MLGRLKREIRGARECADNDALSSSTRSECREEASLLLGLLDELRSELHRERCMGGQTASAIAAWEGGVHDRVIGDR